MRCASRAGNCDVDALPCVVAAREQRDAVSVRLSLLRFDDRSVLLREMRSDGTVLITKGRLAAPGVGAAVGVKGHVELGRLKLAAGVTLEGSALALFDRSRSWLVPDPAAADRLVAALRRGDAPAPDIVSGAHGLESALKLAGGAGTAGASLALAANDLKGLRVDRQTGRRTFFLDRNSSAGVSLTMAEIGARGERDGYERYAVTVDAGGRPLDLVVLRQGTLLASADLPPRLQAVAGLMSRPTRGGRMWAEETHLDLTEPTNLALARSFLTQVTGGPVTQMGSRLAIARALAARLDAVGVEHVRTLAVESSELGLGGDVGLGGRLGADVSRTTIRRRLLDAATRGVDGVWRRRADCLAPA